MKDIAHRVDEDSSRSLPSHGNLESIFPESRSDRILAAGVRGTLRTHAYDFSESIAANPRYSYLFQDGFANPGGRRTIDVSNLTITFGAAAR